VAQNDPEGANALPRRDTYSSKEPIIMRRAVALFALPAVAILGLAAPSVAGTSHTRTAATLTVSTTTSSGALATTAPSVGTPLVFAGCGYQAGVGVTVSVQSPTAIAFFGAVAGQDGCFSTAATETYVPSTAGTYTASSFQSSNRRSDASVTFTVAG
jgi:hypothetical protein